jgi:non-ribosomal peptide synthetase component F
VTASAEASQPASPLSVDQEALWYHNRLAPTWLTYNETISIRKDGPLDTAALRRAFDEIVRRHEAWRSTFEVAGGRPILVVRPAPSFALPVVDLSQLTPEQAERQAVRQMAEVSRVPYDLPRGPLVRPRLFRFPGEHHRLYLAMHHLVFDGVSVTRVILPELVALYDAFRAGRPSPLPEPTVRYSDYARWEQRWVAEPRAKRRLNHWRGHLTSLPAPSLPLDQPRPSEPRLGGGAIPLSLPQPSVERLRAAGQGAGATLFQVLATCWSLLLGRYSGQSEVVFSTAADMRQRPELQNLVGCCLTPLVLRVDLSGDAAFAELIVRVRNELLDVLVQLVPFERVVRQLPPAADASGANPVYQTMLVLEPATEAPDPAWSLHQIDSVLANAVGSVKLDLELQLDERPDGHLSGQLIYNRDLFEPASAERMVDHWLRICGAIADDPAATASSIPTLTASERQLQLVEWNATAVERPAGAVHELIEARALAQPDAIAVSDGERAVSYAEADHQAGLVAARLRAAGVRAGDVVALLSEPSLDLVVGALGVLKAGAAHLLLDPELSAARLRLAVEDAGAATILAQPALADRLEAPAERVLLLGAPDDGEQATTAVSGAVPSAAACCVQYASRPAGEPNGVAIGHGATVNLATALAAELSIGPGGKALVLGSSLFRNPAIELWMPLIAGAEIVLAPAAAAADGSQVSRLVSAEKITFLHASPSAWQTLVDSGLRASRSLRALSGGEPLPEALANQILDRYRVLWNAYGAAQTGGYCTLARVERSAPPTIGRPIANTRAYVLDRDGQPLPLGVYGELVVAGDGLACGHPDRPGAAEEPSAGALIDDPFGPGAAYRTGDLARWLPDGRLQVECWS